jgi:hypothetical protein
VSCGGCGGGRGGLGVAQKGRGSFTSSDPYSATPVAAKVAVFRWRAPLPQAWEKAKMAEERKAAKEAAARAAAAEDGDQPGAAPALPAATSGVQRAGRAVASTGAGRAPVPAAPQVRIVDGRLVVDASSLTVTAQQQDDMAQYARVEEDTRYVNTFTYMKRLGAARWSDTDTELFYRALAAFGTDFSLICMLFPEMQRAHVKRKYTKELRDNPSKVRS